MESMKGGLANANFWRDKRVLVTGDLGFKGTWLVDWLIFLEADVLGIDKDTTRNNQNFFYRNSGYRHLTFDLTSSNHFKEILFFQPEIVFHFAAQPLVLQAYQNPAETMSNNLLGTVNLLSIISELKTRPVTVIASTDKVYKAHETSSPHTEDHSLGGQDPYSLSKVFVELFLDLGINQNLNNIVIIRSGNVFGGGDFSRDRLLPDVFKSWQSRQHLNLRNPHSIRPWLHVLDSLNGYLLSAEHHAVRPHKDAYNLAPSLTDHISVEEVANIAFLYLNSNIQRQYQDSSSPHYERDILLLNADKAKKILGWRPFYSTKEAIEKSLEWYYNFSNTGNSSCLTRKQITDFMTHI